MTDSELDALAEKLADKIQNKVRDGIYMDAGKNLFDMAKKALWAIIIAFAAWGAAKVGSGQG